MPDFDTARFSSPTPGMSLTTEPGNRPWEKPPKYADAEDALGFYIEQLTNPERINTLFDVLERNFPITTLVDSMVITGVMQGLHTIDVGVLIAPALFQLIIGLADISEVDYKSGIDSPTEANPTIISSAIKEAQDEPDKEVDELMQIAEYGIEQMETGIMARPDTTKTGETE
jgi:hypothetical protein